MYRPPAGAGPSAERLYGINLTRAYTVLGKKAGYGGLLSVGRVQTPVLGLVVRRDEAIADFQPKPYFEVFALLVTDQGECFSALQIDAAKQLRMSAKEVLDVCQKLSK